MDISVFENQLHEYYLECIAAPRLKRSADQAAQTLRCLEFLRGDPDCFERSNPRGHFTGSGLVIDKPRRKTLLTHHRKYGKWIQTGGHCDGIRVPFFTAWQEAFQESGLTLITPDNPFKIIDINIELVPAYGDVPEHPHYDIRFLFHASSEETPVISEESNDVKWFSAEDVWEISEDVHLHRLHSAGGLPLCYPEEVLKARKAALSAK